MTTTGPADPTGHRPIVTFTYNADGEVLSKTDALGRTTSYVRDNLGRLVEEDDPSPDGKSPGPVLKWVLDKDSNVTDTIDALGNDTRDVFDNRNRRVEEIKPAPSGSGPGPATQDVYDPAGQLTEEIDPMGHVTQYGHDAEGNLDAVILPDPKTGGPASDGSTKTVYGHDYDGNTTSMTNPQLNSTFYTYDDLNQKIQETDPPPTTRAASPVTTWQYNADGELVKEIDPLGRSQTTTLDGMGRATAQTDFTGVLTSWAYNNLSEITTQTVSGAGQQSAVTTNSWDNLGDKTAIQDPNGGLTKMAFDLAGNMTSLTDPSNNTETWTRNNLDQVTQDQTSAGTRTFQYDTSGNVTDEVDRDGRERQFLYDNLGQQTAENWIGAGGQGSVSVTHTVTGYGSHVDTWQTIVPPHATGGTWTLSLGAQTTQPMPYNVGYSDLSTALTQAFGPYIWLGGNGTADDPFVVGFMNDDAGSDVPTLVADTSNLTGMTSPPAIAMGATGHPGTDAEDDVLFVSGQPPSSGYFYLELDGHTTTAIDYNATGAAVAAALEALPGVSAGNVFVFKSVWEVISSPPSYVHEWFVRFTGALSGQHVDALTVPSFAAYDAGGAEVYVYLYGLGGSGADDVQQVVVTAGSGTFTLTYHADASHSETTPALPYNANAAQVQDALNALNDVNLYREGARNVTVSGSGTTSNPFVVTFAGELSGHTIAPLTASFFTDVVRTISTAYNLDGQITSIGDQDSQYAFAYNGQGQQTSVDNNGTTGVPDVLLNSQYDVLGDRTSLSAAVAGTPDFLNTYSYDTLQRMTAETQQGQPGGNAVATKGISFGYDPIGDITSTERYTNITQAPSPATDAADTALAYSNLGQLTSEQHAHNGTTIENLSWTFDTLDRVSTFTSNDGLASYGYDKASQVVSATYSGGNPPPNFTTTYDPSGVRNATGDTVGPNNHLTSDGTFNWGYDNEGNVISRVRLSTAPANDYQVLFDWEYRNRLTDVLFYNNSGTLTQQVHYVYDVFDHLIERDDDATGGGAYTQVAHYVWDGDNVVLQFNGEQQLTNRYLDGPDTSASDAFFSTLAEEAVSSLTSPGTVTFDLADNQGSVRNVVSASGTVEDHINYTVGGQVASESKPSVPHLTSFAGGFLDPATQMLNEYHRWLVLADGFWASQDPLGLLGGDTNVTRDVGNNLTNEVDPTGLAGVGHHYVPVSVLNTLRQDGLLTDAAYGLGMGYTSGETLPSHHFGTYGGISHKAYNDEVLALARAEAGKSPTGRLNARQMRDFVDQKILGDECPNSIKKFNADINKQRKAFLTEQARTAKRPPKALKRVKGPPPKPPTNTELIAKGRRFMSSRGFALAAVAGPLAGILDTFIGDTVGAMDKVSTSNNFREIMAGLTAGDLDRANRAMGDLGLQTGLLGEVIDGSSYKQAVLLRDAWQSAVGEARAAQYRNFELKLKAELDDGPPEPAPEAQVPAEPAPPTIYDGVNELVPGGRGPVEQ